MIALGLTKLWKSWLKRVSMVSVKGQSEFDVATMIDKFFAL